MSRFRRRLVGPSVRFPRTWELVHRPPAEESRRSKLGDFRPWSMTTEHLAHGHHPYREVDSQMSPY